MKADTFAKLVTLGSPKGTTPLAYICPVIGLRTATGAPANGEAMWDGYRWVRPRVQVCD